MEKLKELKDKLKSFEFAINNQYQLPVVKDMVQKEIKEVERQIEKLESEQLTEYLLKFITSEPIKIDPKKTYHIVTSKDDLKPRKIKITDKTEKTIVYVNVATQTQSDRMFISDFLKNYTIHESFD